MSVLEKLKRLRFPRFGRSVHSVDVERPVVNTDALAATPGKEGEHVGLGHSGYPPNYVKTDDGRPRH